jgi:NAD(P)-dependent dehydrogenase (short-subunit alcohol dehydrogenase family)
MPVAVVTGASRGFGRALARSLAADGWALVVDARHGEELAAAAAELASLGADVRAVPGDVTDPAHRHALVEAARGLGGLDLLVNNAGTLGPTPLPPLGWTSPEDLAEVLRVNVVAQLALVQAALTLLRQSHGTVVAVTSDAAVEAYEGWGAYGASKAALEQLHHVLAAEEPDLTVYRFDPGDMRTQMHQDAFPGEDISDRPDPSGAVAALRALLDAAPPSGRYRAAELAEVPA